MFLLILDGAEEDAPLINEYSPPAGACMPRLSTLVTHGTSGFAKFFLTGREADSLTCILSMLGVPADDIPPTRAPIEALGAGIELQPGDTVCRCNLISIKDGRLASFNGGALSRGQMQSFAAEASRLAPDGLCLFHLSDYRNLLVSGDEPTVLPPDAPPPHECVGMPIKQLLAGIKYDSRLSQFIGRSGRILPGYLLYPWGVSRTAALPTYKSLTGRTAACVCGAEVMAGIGKALGMTVFVPPGATGDADSDLRAKADAALRLSGNYDTVVVHINGADELAHRHDLQGKKHFLERVDKDMIGRMLDGLERDARFLVTSDHVTSCETGRHKKLPVQWVCADFNARERLLTPLRAGESLDGRRLFEQLSGKGMG